MGDGMSWIPCGITFVDDGLRVATAYLEAQDAAWTARDRRQREAEDDAMRQRLEMRREQMIRATMRKWFCLDVLDFLGLMW